MRGAAGVTPMGSQALGGGGYDSNQTKPKPNQTKPNQTKNQIKSNQTKQTTKPNGSSSSTSPPISASSSVGATAHRRPPRVAARLATGTTPTASGSCSSAALLPASAAALPGSKQPPRCNRRALGTPFLRPGLSARSAGVSAAATVRQRVQAPPGASTVASGGGARRTPRRPWSARRRRSCRCGPACRRHLPRRGYDTASPFLAGGCTIPAR